MPRRSDADSHLSKRSPGVHLLTRRLTEPGFGITVNKKGNLKPTTPRANDSQTIRQATTVSSLDTLKISGEQKFTPQKLSTGDNIGKEYLLELKPEETLKASPKTNTKTVTPPETEEIAFDNNFKFAIEQERKRQLIIAEMMQTEKTYLEFLQTVVMLFIIPLRKSLRKDSEPLLTEEQIQIVFQNIEEINAVNGDLLKQMAKRKRKSTVHWADMLFHCWSEAEFNQAYQQYINGYTQARLFVSKAMKPLPPNPTPEQEALSNFAEFVNKQLSNDLCLGFGSLTSFLITPIQRLPRYLLYLKDLHSYTPEGHPDRNDVERAYDLLSEMTAQIDQQKLKYDEIYHLQALHQRFVPKDRYKVPEILDDSQKLLAEGPMLEIPGDSKGKKEAKEQILRYIVLFSNVMICAIKDDKESLHLEWKVNLYCSSIQHKEKSNDADEEHFIVTENVVTGGNPLMLKRVFYLYPFSEGPFSGVYWKKHLNPFIQGEVDNYNLTKTGIAVARKLQKTLLYPSDWDHLCSSKKVYKQDETVQEEGSTVSSFSYIKEGRCCIAKKVKGKQVILGIMEAGELFSEMSFLSNKSVKEASASVLSIKDRTTILQIPFEVGNKLLAEDCSLAKRFFHSMCALIAGRYLKVVFQKTGSYLQSESAFSTKSFAALPSLSSEILSILEKHELTEKDFVAEYKCKVKGKIGGGHLMICKEIICIYSRALFGHLSKTSISASSVLRVKEISGNHSAIIEYSDASGKHKHMRTIEIQFTSEYQRQEALMHLAGFVGHAKGNPCESFELSASDWATITADQKHSVYEAKQVIVPKGKQLRGIYQVVKGKCKVVYRIGDNEIEFGITTGDIFGEIPFLLGVSSNAMLIGKSEQTVVRLITNKQLQTVLYRNTDITPKFYLFLARSLRSRFMNVQNSLLKIGKNSLESVSKLRDASKLVLNVAGPTVITRMPSDSSPSILHLDAPMPRKRTASFHGTLSHADSDVKVIDLAKRAKQQSSLKSTNDSESENSKSESSTKEPEENSTKTLDTSGGSKRRPRRKSHVK